MGYRKATQGDTEEIVKLHLKKIKSPLMRILGKEISTEIFKQFFSSPFSFSYVYEENNQIMGFLLVSSNTAGFIKYLLSKKILLMFIKRFFHSPDIILIPFYQVYQDLQERSIKVEPKEMGLLSEKHSESGKIVKNLICLWAKEVVKKGISPISKVYIPEDKKSVISFLKRFYFVKYYRCIKFYGKKIHIITVEVPMPCSIIS